MSKVEPPDDADKRRDEILRRMLKMPPKPHKPPSKRPAKPPKAQPTR